MNIEALLRSQRIDGSSGNVHMHPYREVAMGGLDCSCSALRMAARRVSQAYDAALAPEGLTVSQYALLSTLATQGAEVAPPTVSVLAETLALDRTTLGHNLRPLERDGFVLVEPDAGDGRIRRIRLTQQGRAKRDRCLPLWRATQERFDAAFGPARAEALRDDLIAIARAADEVFSPSPTGQPSHAG